MKVVGINGSTQKDGNTALLVRTALEQLEEQGVKTELIQLAGQDVQPCRACWACGGRGNCAWKQDAFCDVFEAMRSADGIVLGSPSYSANVSARMQALLERAAVVTDANPGILSRKAGASVSAARRAGALQATETMNRFFLNHEMYVVGSTYWNVAYGQMPGDVADDEEGMATVRNLGANMAHLLQALDQA